MTSKSRSSIQTDITNNVADNGTGDVSAADVRDILTDINDSELNLNDANEFSKTQNFNATVLTDGANISWDASSNQVAKVTLAGNRTLDNPTNLIDGATYVLRVIQDATGSRTLAYGSAYDFPGGTAPTLTAAANAVDVLTFLCDGTNMLCVSQGDFK